MVRAEIITIGDEILIGQIVDTNSAWIADRLADLGVVVHQITSISDNADHIRQAMDRSLEYADVVIITGGLGPTKDDITKRTLAEYFGMPLVRDADTLEHVSAMMAARGVDFNVSNQDQALVPEGCGVLRNENGTAPGMVFDVAVDGNQCLVFSLPGVPFEMKALFDQRAAKDIAVRFGPQHVVHRTINLFGIAESVLSELIEPWELALPPYLHLAYLPGARVIRLRLSAYGDTPDDVEDVIDAQFAALRPLVSRYFLGDDPMSVEGALAVLLMAQKATLAVAESCTGGAMSARVTAMAGASCYYKGGVCAYSNDIKCRLLNVDAGVIERHGAVSIEVAEAMASGVRDVMGSTYGVATTGVAGPGGGTDEKPVGMVCVAVAWDGGVQSRVLQLGQLREQNIERSATYAFDMLRLLL